MERNCPKCGQEYVPVLSCGCPKPLRDNTLVVTWYMEGPDNFCPLCQGDAARGYLPHAHAPKGQAQAQGLT